MFPHPRARTLAKVMLLALPILMGCPKIIEDQGPTTVEANDLTALVDGSETYGCGRQLQSGLVFCRVSERQATSSKLYFLAPISNCSKPACVYVSIFYPTSEPTLEISIPKGQSQVGVTWKDLTKSETFAVNQRGFWQFVRKIYWNDADGREHSTVDEGLIYLRVLRADYEPLQEARNHPLFAWEGVWKGVPFKMTTKGRTYVGKPGEEP